MTYGLNGGVRLTDEQMANLLAAEAATLPPQEALKLGALIQHKASERMGNIVKKGYVEGKTCPECMKATLVRNGTTCKCDTCGSTFAIDQI